jgi:hypothetical protein
MHGGIKKRAVRQALLICGVMSTDMPIFKRNPHGRPDFFVPQIGLKGVIGIDIVISGVATVGTYSAEGFAGAASAAKKISSNQSRLKPLLQEETRKINCHSARRVKTEFLSSGRFLSGAAFF